MGTGCDEASEKFTALRGETLCERGLLWLGRHVHTCPHCRLQLLIILDDIERCGRTETAHVKALAALADVDVTRESDWLIAMFSTVEAQRADRSA
jgi:hypothetical protein